MATNAPKRQTTHVPGAEKIIAMTIYQLTLNPGLIYVILAKEHDFARAYPHSWHEIIMERVG